MSKLLSKAFRSTALVALLANLFRKEHLSIFTERTTTHSPSHLNLTLYAIYQTKFT